MKLRDLEIKSNVIQSPMAGCTDLAFRTVAREHGMEFAFLEMVSCESLVRKSRKTFELMKTEAVDKPVGCQLVGQRPEAMGEAAAMVEDMGLYDLIDINMGCPVPKITGPGGGSALLREPATARQIFRSMMRNIKNLPLTVKMRIGFDDPTGDEAVQIARIAEEEGLVGISVHGRTRAQGYSGIANWEAIGKIKKAVSIPVFGNGDVNCGDDAKRMLEVSGCDGVMLGRGALGNPWIYKSIEAAIQNKPQPPVPTFEDRKKAFLRHFELELKTEGEFIGLLKCRKIAGWYFKGFSNSADLRNRVNQSKGVQEIRDIVHQYEATCINNTDDGDLPNSCQLEDE